jgi:hypothetical protein
MKQTGNTINPGNIQHFADSAANAIQLGQRQFFTPPDLAAALCCVFKNSAATIATDLMAGSGHLLAASKRKHKAGIDVDERSASQLSASQHFSIYQADATRFFPLAHAAGLEHDLLLLNPPFSLQWYLDRLAPLATSTIPGVREAYAAARAKGDTMDSTLATFLIALESLSGHGEGFMICNADTARRLIGDPEADPSMTALDNRQELLRNVWCWLDVPGAVYENQHSKFPTAVLYFSASHGHACRDDHRPLYLHAPSADPATVERTLATAISARPFAFCGRSIAHDYQAQDWKGYKETWDAVRAEYHQLHHGAPPAYNLMLGPEGTIRTHLDPYRRAAYRHDRALLTALRSMHGETPAALVVQQASRSALKHAMHSGAWRVQPELVAAVAAALAAYESVRAPFYTPNEVQSLGWLDEESEIQCERSGIPGFRPGQAYPLQSWIEDTAWRDTRTNLEGKPEKLELSGRELVICITDDDEKAHHFHVRRDDAQIGDAGSIHHHHIKSLIAHFHIPIPKDVAQSNPDAYQTNLARLTQLEALVNTA